MSSAGVVVRNAREGDVDVIVDFNARLAWESEHKRLDEGVLRRGVLRALAHPELCRYFVAEADGAVVGQTMLTFEVTDWRDGLVYWIQSVYVRPEARGRGVFKALYRHVLDEAKRSGDARGVRLYVEKDNAPAIATYGRLGMQQAHFHIYETDV